MLDSASLHQRALEAHRAGRYASARRLLQQASERNDSPDLTGRLELAWAYVDAETGDAEAGLRRCRAALDLPGLTPVTRGLIWSQLGLLHLRAGAADEAFHAFSTAIELLADEPEHLGRVLLNQGNLHLQRHAPAAAADDLSRAHAVLVQAGARIQAAKAEHNLGYARLLTGDVIGALALMESAGNVLADLSPVSRAVGAQDRAEVLLAAGRIGNAIDALETASKAYGAQRLPRFQAEAELVLARTLLHGDPLRARVVARRAARRFLAQGSQPFAARATALELIGAIESDSRSPRLRDRADALVSELRAEGIHRDAEQLALHLVRFAVRRNELGDAADRVRAVRLDDATPIGTRLLDREVRAELAQARGHRKRAMQHVRAGLADLQAWQSSFGSLDLQSTLVGHGNHLARMGLELALADGTPAVVFEWSERARALASRVTPVRPPRDPQLAADLTELRVLGDEDPQRRDELREKIRSQSWYGEAGGGVVEPATLAELQASLAEIGAALVAHIVVGDQMVALVVTDADAVVVPLADPAPARATLDRVAADLDMVAAHPTGPLAAAVRSSLRSELAAVADALVTPLLPVVGGRRVVLTPSALFAGTPWSLLPGLAGRALTVPPSATRWRQLRSSAITSTPRVGLVAGPRVARASEEVRRAAAAWPRSESLVDGTATADRVAELAGRVDVLHLAGHGQHSGDHPLFSAVELDDGPWFGHDIDTLPHIPSVVVLSACELGQMSVRSAEETVGMTAAWLHAGARTVVSSTALVADDVACEALARWHQLVATGAAPADALAEVSSAADDFVPFLSFGAGW